MAKGDNYYFECFAECVNYANDAAAMLEKVLKDYKPETVQSYLAAMHRIEHTADMVKHRMMDALAKEFLPPIEREDIVELAHKIDNVTDCIEDVLVGMYMYNIQALRPDVEKFTSLIMRCCSSLTAAIFEFPNYRKSSTLMDRLIEINTLEEDGDRLFTDSMHRLFAEETDPVAIIGWDKLYKLFEKCCDCCEDVAELLEEVVLKNS